MKQENINMAMAILMTAVLASTGMYVAMEGNFGDEQDTFRYEFPDLELGDYVAANLYDAMSPDINSDLRNFGSFSELKAFLDKHAREQIRYNYNYGIESGAVDSAAGAPSMMGMGSSEEYYSNTNIQVAGVDEGDIVKNDAKHAYIISGDGESMFIVRASPVEEIGMMCEIASAGTFVDLYVHGDRLIMLEQLYYFEGGFGRSNYMYSDTPMVTVKVFDILNRSVPILLNEAVLGGNYLTSRLIDGTLYVMGNQYIQQWDNESQVPVPIEALHYIETSDEESYALTSFMTLDISDDDAIPSIMGIMMECSNSIYVSEKNIYITHIKYQENVGLFGGMTDGSETTMIHRIGIQGQDLKYRAAGEVPGRVLNRFSMDEFNGHFRIATTKGWSWSSEQSRNMVHVLDMALEPTGALDNIAPGEQIYSARFMGARLYLVTFRQVDPFYVIDLHDAENPKILGELKIPGYSTYLHPYDENHIIGLGKDGSDVKISLFNVSDVENPTELDTWAFGNGNAYSDSEALYDPHAFMFSREKNLLVIPVSGYDYNSGQYESGACVFRVSPVEGITQTGRVTHEADDAGENDYYGYYYRQYNQIRRSFIIGETLYTVSNTMMKANAIKGLGELAQVNLE